MELQDTYATVYGNTIYVNNTEPYTTDNFAFGISYCQWTNHTHYYDIQNNSVTVYNADYAVYILDVDTDGTVMYNNLIATNSTASTTGDDAVKADNLWVSDNN